MVCRCLLVSRTIFKRHRDYGFFDQQSNILFVWSPEVTLPLTTCDRGIGVKASADKSATPSTPNSANNAVNAASVGTKL